MSKYPVFVHRSRELRRAGEVIAGDLVWTDETAPAIREAFSIANNWRDSHAYPMRSIRYTVLHQMRSAGIEGISSARLKRMQAIRRKLRRVKLHLNQLQDLGGCRVILNKISDVKRLVEFLRGGSSHRHAIRTEDDYITRPKADGYRSHHLIFNYVGIGQAEIFNGRRIELQVRTRLQHAWATGVEAVGLFRGEDLKSHQGNADWLRLFRLLSAEFAEAEGAVVDPDCADRDLRISEILDLERNLQAIETLQNIRLAVRGTDRPVIVQGFRIAHYLIRYDHVKKIVSVDPYFGPKLAAESYDNAEALDRQAQGERETVVLVEVDKIENLKKAYPNYFGDVAYLLGQLRAITRGDPVLEYSEVPPQPPPVPLGPYGDLSWLRQGRFRKPGR